MLKKVAVVCASSLVALAITGCTYSHVLPANTDTQGIKDVCVVTLPNTAKHPANSYIQENIVEGLKSVGIKTTLIPKIEVAYARKCTSALKYSTRGGVKDKIGYVHVRMYNVGEEGVISPNGEISHRQPLYISKPEERQQKITQLLRQMLSR
ncbi:MAG: hypothetical protein ACI4ND_08685 [Succinivibrio sp.]